MTYTHKRTLTKRHTEYIQQHKHNVQMHSVTLVSESSKSTKKKTASVSLLWGPIHQAAFKSMKQALTTAPVLGYADYTKLFIVETDASHDGLSAILSQEQDGRKQRVIAYAS